MSKILTAAHQASGTSGDYIINLVFLFMVLCWGIGIVDPYRIGKKMNATGNSLSPLSHSSGNHSHNERMDNDTQ